MLEIKNPWFSLYPQDTQPKFLAEKKGNLPHFQVNQFKNFEYPTTILSPLQLFYEYISRVGEEW